MRPLVAAAYDRLILGRPVLVLLGLISLLGFFAGHIDDFDLDASADSLLLENDEDLRTFRKVSRRYGTREFLFVIFQPKQDMFSSAALLEIGAMRDELKTVDGVEDTLSILDVPLLKNIEGTLLEVSKNYRTLADEDIDRSKARRELTSSPIFSDLIISKDGSTTGLLVYLSENERYTELQRRRNDLLRKRASEGLTSQEARRLESTREQYEQVKETVGTERHRTITEIREVLERHEDAGELHLSGVAMIADDMIRFIRNDLLVFGLGVFALLVGMLSLIFRQLRWVALPLASCAFAGTVMVGLLGLIGWEVTVISSNFISLMLILTMSMNIHLVVRYRQLRRDFPDDSQRETVFKTTRRMVWPCLYTALTTIMAFASLVVSDIKPVIDFGWMMTIGLTVTFLTSFLLFPTVLVLLNPSSGADADRSETRFTALLSGATERKGNLILAVAVMLAIVSAWGIARLEVENSFISYFSEDTEIYQGLRLLDRKLGGTTPLDVRLEFEPPPQPDFGDDEFATMFEAADKSDAWFTPEKVDLVKSIHDYLEGIPAVGKVLSLASMLRVAEDLHGEEFDTFQLAILYKRLPEELKETLLTPYVSIEHDEARISVRVQDSREGLRRAELLERIHSDLQSRFELAPSDYQVTGLLVLYNNMLQSLFRSQILTLGVVMAGIALMLMLLFRSVSLAIIGIVPNLLAAAMILGLMGLLEIPLDMMTITIAAITIGIAVDNSIHYIYRYREEFARSGDYVETLHYCHANIGKAVFYTAITIIMGFSILVLSNFIPTIYFGLLTALAMAVALFAALTLLPKLILLWRPFGPGRAA